MTSFNLRYLFKGPIPKYGPTRVGLQCENGARGVHNSFQNKVKDFCINEISKEFYIKFLAWEFSHHIEL